MTAESINTGITQQHKVVKKKKRKKKKKNVYWTEETEAAIKDFLNLDVVYLTKKLEKHQEKKKRYKIAADITIDDGYEADLKHRIEQSTTPEVLEKKDKIFKKHIEKPLYRLVESIIFTYELFSNDVDVKTLQKICVTHLYLKFGNFDPEKGTKSYSYYGTVAKHYLQNRRKNLYESRNSNLNWEDHKDEADQIEQYEMDFENEDDELFEFVAFISESFEEDINKKGLSTNDLKVVNTIIEMFENADMFEDDEYNKAKIHEYIKDTTKLSSRELAYSLGRIKKSYFQKKFEYIRKKEE